MESFKSEYSSSKIILSKYSYNFEFFFSNLVFNVCNVVSIISNNFLLSKIDFNFSLFSIK